MSNPPKCGICGRFIKLSELYRKDVYDHSGLSDTIFYHKSCINPPPMPNPTPELPEDITTQISQEAEIYSEEAGEYIRNVHEYSTHSDINTGYIAGAEKYAALYLDSERRRKEAMELLEPILDWGQGNPELKLGTSITKEVLERAKGFSVLRDALERITRMSETHGRPDCKWGDTDFNSAAVAYGQNLLLEDVKHMAYKALALFPVDKKKEEENK